MPTLLPTVLALASVAALTDPPSTEPDPLLPATCLADLGPGPVEPPGRLRALLPTVTFAVDHRPDRRGRDRLDSPVETRGPTTGRHLRDYRRTTRWTLQLRWTTGRPGRSHFPVEPTRPPVSPYCTELLELRAAPPADLEEALDRWIEISRYRARLDHADEEVRDD